MTRYCADAALRTAISASYPACSRSSGAAWRRAWPRGWPRWARVGPAAKGAWASSLRDGLARVSLFASRLGLGRGRSEAVL